MVARNLYKAASEAIPGEEQFTPLAQGAAFRLVRIDSHGHASPPGHWYDQENDEWVLLARGEAVLELEHAENISLTAGDYLLLPAHCRHRVAQVSADAIWLALHFQTT